MQKLDARLGYASAACGADILFLEAILELGGEAHVVLPLEREQLIVALLFADVVQFSRLTEDRMLPFLQNDLPP